ncbi:MAG: membrane protein insertase YidC, partial [Syntrophales bacterium]
MDKKTILAIMLSMVVIFIYNLYFVPKHIPKKAMAPSQNEAIIAEKKSPPEPARTGNPAITSAPVPAPLKIQGETMAARQDIRIETPLYIAVFTPQGGTLKSFRLKQYKQSIKKDAPVIEMVHVEEGMPSPLTVTFPESSFDIPGDLVFDVNQKDMNLIMSDQGRPLVFSRTFPDKIRVDKIFTFYPDKYSFDLDVKVFNLSNQPVNENAGLAWYQYLDPKIESDRYGHDGPVVYAAKNIERQDVKKLDALRTIGPDITWGGFETKYFLAAMIPQNPSLTSLSMSRDERNLVSVGLKGPKNLIPQGEPASFRYTIFLGPKDYNILKSQGLGLENAIDFGSWLKWLAMPLLLILKFLYQYVHNYGIAIIILTTMIKVVFWPLGNKSYKSMKGLQKLQPKLKELQEKYKDDRAKLSQETMAMYKSHKINPLGGCLPILIQIPVFFGLYRALLYAIELRH